jgi:hypothetical protein
LHAGPIHQEVDGFCFLSVRYRDLWENFRSSCHAKGELDGCEVLWGQWT